MWLWIIAGCLVVVIVLGVAGNLVGRYMGWTVLRHAPEALSAELAHYYAIRRPEGDGPFPAALLFSGCDGPRDNLDRWSDMLVGAGWAAIVVDSHTPRGYDNFELWRLICAGQLLSGTERAADVLVGLRDARRMDFVDPDRIVMIGASHGGWSIMELLLFAANRRVPYALRDLPEGVSRDRMLDGLVGQILLYPYCGPANRARKGGWSWPSPSLFLLARNDTIAPAEDCQDVISRLIVSGMPVEVEVFEGVTHGFDQQEKAPLSMLDYDPEATERALAIGRRFLRQFERG